MKRFLDRSAECPNVSIEDWRDRGRWRIERAAQAPTISDGPASINRLPFAVSSFDVSGECKTVLAWREDERSIVRTPAAQAKKVANLDIDLVVMMTRRRSGRCSRVCMHPNATAP